MKRIAFAVSWFYKAFTPTTILVTIVHICTCDDVTLVNEKSIVSWKYMKSNKKYVFNVNFQNNHKQVPTAYLSMMFNIHKHISHLIFVLIPDCGVYEICNQKIIVRSISRQRPFLLTVFIVINRNRNRPFNLIQNKVGYRSCFATGVKLEQFSWNSFDVK
jgi:hypothetical protein